MAVISVKTRLSYIISWAYRSWLTKYYSVRTTPNSGKKRINVSYLAIRRISNFQRTGYNLLISGIQDTGRSTTIFNSEDTFSGSSNVESNWGSDQVIKD